jgi:type VI secretion system protein ImpM
MLASTEVGLYGKLPSHGDFLRRRVSDAFVGPWDGWLQDSLSTSRLALADKWLDVYLTSPAWRFACASGAAGPAAVVGVMAPSVDRVGRYFPLTLVAELPDGTDPVTAATRAASFFEAAERLVIETLAAERVDFAAFDEQVVSLGELLECLHEPPTVALDPAAAVAVLGNGDAQWQLSLGSAPQLGAVFEQLLSHQLSAHYDPLSLWWTEGSSVVAPSCLIVRGLPSPDAFAALLDGSWSLRQWRQVPLTITGAPETSDTLVDDLVPPRFRSAAATDVGALRAVNQDSYLERSEVGVWVVADGLGGHRDGEVASRMVCDALADFVPDAGFEQMVDGTRERLDRVNDHLVRVATRENQSDGAGSTVVAFLARGSRCAILWAGDSRLYRLRQGQLEQLTRDHSLALEGTASVLTPNAITRAIGAEATLMLDQRRERVQAGDRYLLCSDGLTRTVPEDRIRAWMTHDDVRQAVDGLIQATLEGGAPDNVTALIVEAYS